MAGIPVPGEVRYARPPYSKQDTAGGLVTVIVRVRHLMIVFGGSVLVTITVFVTVGAGLKVSAAGLAGVEPHALRMTPMVSTASTATVGLMVSVLAVTSSMSHCLSAHVPDTAVAARHARALRHTSIGTKGRKEAGLDPVNLLRSLRVRMSGHDRAAQLGSGTGRHDGQRYSADRCPVRYLPSRYCRRMRASG